MLNQVIDMMPRETEPEKLEAPNGLSTCEDYLLDIESGESITNLDNDMSEGMQYKIQGSHTPVDQAGSDGTPQESGSSGTTNRVNDCQEDLDINDSESHGIFSCTAESEMLIEDRWFKYPASFSVESIDKLEDVSSMFSEDDKDMIFNPGLSSGAMFFPLITMQENGHSSVGPNANGTSILGQDVLTRCPNQASTANTRAEKRLRKPPQRFIDELSGPNLKSIRRKGEVSSPLSRSKSRKASHRDRDRDRDMPRVERSLLEDSAGKAIQVPFAPLVCKESQKLDVPIAVKASCSEQVVAVSASEEDCVAMLKSVEDCCRRKHHILWTVSEVRKLIDGVSLYGVGRWSHIKKDLFASSAHRTSVDLKDKWRNLLKATSVQSESKRGEHRKRNLAWRPLPKSVLRRVRELAITYPYPRDLRSKH